MVGANEEEIEKKIRMLRGLSDPKSHMGLKPVTYGIGITLKGDRMQAYREMYKTRNHSVKLEFQPRGLRLLSKDVTSVHYLPETKRIVVRLNGSDMAKGIPYEWSKNGPNRLLIRSLDTRYFYDLDPAGGPAERVETFELEYRVVLEMSEQVRALQNPVITLNGEKQDWSKIQKEGLNMDYLPEKLQIRIEGTTEDDIDINMNVEFDLDENLPAFP